MRLTLMGKMAILMLAIGLAVGGLKWQQKQQAAGKSGGSRLAQQEAGGSGTGGHDIEFIITAAKQDWVQEEVDRFNEANAGKWHIVTKALPSREAMHAILEGKEKPVLWSPGSPVWPTRLAEAWSAKHGGALLDMSDPNAYRVFLRSPLVFLTTRQKAKFLRPLLGGEQPWLALRKLSLHQVNTPWTWFRFSHADPLTSSSGMLTLGLILYDYGERTGQGGQLSKVTNDPKFLNYLGEVERGLIYDKPAALGTTKLTQAFLEDASRYDVITAYESAALEAAPRNPDLAVIYPHPTAVSEHAVTLLSGDWVSPEQRAGALALINFLGTKEALQAGIKHHFRPAQSNSALSLAGELAKYSAQGFEQSYPSIELPPYEALNAAAFRWHQHIAKTPPR